MSYLLDTSVLQVLHCETWLLRSGAPRGTSERENNIWYCICLVSRAQTSASSVESFCQT
ncbi:hypothetical protein DPMN_127616 [Dreissena polymorpha]|uniref:Uncharacterized protein n=1 Tax=Dreissena polymorpha TaxID=45954 RepID=A0A9D4H1I6_DREPO|nr:hypothetical protein DPMN_127616 [Dreissena polymorpha]